LHDISIEKVKVGEAKNVFDQKEFYKNVIMKEFNISGQLIEMN